MLSRAPAQRPRNGKQQSRRNALRHGLTAETVIEPLENPEKYRAFEEAIVSEYLPQTPVERELVHRLASLFWRLRRATSIETGLLRMQSEILHAFRTCRQKMAQAGEGEGSVVCSYREDAVLNPQDPQVLDPDIRPAKIPSRDIAVSFLRLANLDSEIVDRLSRYEAGLWRQLAQTLFALQTLKRR